MTDAIVTERLTKFYGRKKVVDNLTLRVPQGCVYGLLGRNGAGKSTTIKMLLGMVHQDYGRAELLGEDVAALTPHTRGRIAYVAEGHPLFSWMTVGQITKFHLAFFPAANRWFVKGRYEWLLFTASAPLVIFDLCPTSLAAPSLRRNILALFSSPSSSQHD